MSVRSKQFIYDYLKHSAIIVVSFVVTYFLANDCYENPILAQIFAMFTFLYTAAFFFGWLYGFGPLKYLGKLYAESEVKEPRNKQPWE